jgi:hypothetical protein
MPLSVRNTAGVPRAVSRALAVLAAVAALFPAAPVHAESCESVVHALNQRLSPRIDEDELVSILRSLNGSRGRSLPPKFVTKRQARSKGWAPGMDLWAAPGLRGKSIGGDRFNNREGRLPDGGRGWREADLDYNGGRRGGKRVVFSENGRRMVTVDHYSRFVEVPVCQ